MQTRIQLYKFSDLVELHLLYLMVHEIVNSIDTKYNYCKVTLPTPIFVS